MKRSMMILVASLIFTNGCSEGDPSFSLLSDKDVFVQAKNLTNTKIDILWVIDNSGSMQTSQDNLVQEFEKFIDGFRDRNYDFQMAVTTTDAYKSFFTGDPAKSRFKDGVGTTHTGHFIVNKDTPDFENVFLTNVLQGTGGNGDERAFSSFREALNNTLNVGLVRPDSFLAVIIVSDEDDFSTDNAAFNNSYTNPALHTIQSYVDYLDNLTNSTAIYKRYSVSAMSIWDQQCLDLLNTTFTGRKIGIRYGELVDATGGEKGSLCGNFSEDLDVISEGIIQLATQFYLSRIPVPSSIKVIINGKTIAKVADPLNPDDGWLYNATNNSIVFYGTAIPDQGSEIDIKYDPVAVGQ